MPAGTGPLASGTAVGRYRIDGPLGRGGMAIVYEATHEALGRRVALKVLAAELGSDPEFVERFRREGQLQASLEHPHIVTIYEAGESAHGLYIAMALIRGSTLAGLIHDGGVAAERALALLRQVAEALDAAAAGGLVHRDVKPRNVLVGEDDHAYLADFGLTKLGGESGVTVTGQLVGTLAYLAPEIIRGEAATRASDVYAFAAMIFECLGGGPVFPRTTQAATLYAHMMEPPPRISRRRAGLPPALDAVLERALAKHPSERPATAVGLIDEVAEAMSEVDLARLGPPPAPDPRAEVAADTTIEPLVAVPPPPPAARSQARTAAMLAAAALAGAAVAVGVALLAEGDAAPTRAADGAPATLAGAIALGSDLAEPGRAQDCRGSPVSDGSAGCTILQTRLPGATLVVPRDGVVRRWAVRSARGELALSALRPRDGGYFQIALSRSEFAGNDGAHLFDTQIAVERGDVLSLRVLRGSGVGMRPTAAGAATSRWIPRLKGNEIPAQAGPAAEVLMRAELMPGRALSPPPQVRGRAAATLPAGRPLRTSKLRYNNGRPVEIRLVELPGHLALDLWRGGRRLARQQLPADFRPGGQVITYEVEPDEPTEPEQVGTTIEYANEDSARILSHHVVAYGREFEFID